MKKIIVIDTSYNLNKIKKLKIENIIYSRSLNDYFTKVISVHPVSTIDEQDSYKEKYGNFNIIKLDSKHYYIEGKIGYFKSLKFLNSINFLIAQIQLFIFLKKYIKDEKINFIKAGSPNYAGLFAYMLSKFTSIPYILRIGSNNDKIYEVTKRPIEKRFFKLRIVEKFFEKKIIKNASHIIAANNNNLNFALKNSARLNNSSVIRYSSLVNSLHYVDPKDRMFDINLFQKYNLKKNNFIVYVGRLEEVKHPIDPILVLQKLKKEGFELKLIMFGDGSQRKKLKNYCFKNGIDNHVIFAGNVDQITLSKIIPYASLVLSPHTGRALVEVGLGRVPVVAYDIDWQSELIIHEETGELVPYRDLEKFFSSAKKILNKNSYSKLLSTNLRRLCINLFDPNKTIEEEVKIYENL